MQGHDGLGMEAQRRAVSAYAATHSATILAIYSEVETGRRKDLWNRPQLIRALGHARRSKAVLVIARMDRLARNVFVTSQLLESGVEFVACDNPHANRMTIQILAVMAEHESRMISERVKATVAIRRARGDDFRCFRKLTPEQMRMGQIAAAEANRRRTREAYADLVPIVRQLRESGDTLRSIATSLNDLGHQTRGGGNWTSAGIYHFLKREGLGHLQSRAKTCPPVRKEVQRIGTIIAGRLRTARAEAAYAPLIPLLVKLTEANLSARAIAVAFNKRGHRTQFDSMWSYATVLALQRRENLVAVAVPSGVRGGFAPEVQMLGVAVAAKMKRHLTQRRDARIMPLVEELQRSGLCIQAIVASLHAAHLCMPKGNPWTVVALQKLIKRQAPR